MWQSSMAHHRPSATVESMSFASPRRSPNRAPGSRYGAPFIDSMPPAMTSSASPARISEAASMMAFSPEPHTRLIVVALVVSGRPAWSAAWRAGAWPLPACRTWPIRTSSTCDRGRIQPGALDGGPDGDAAERGRRDAAQRTAELADRGARRADDVGLAVGDSCMRRILRPTPSSDPVPRRRHAASDMRRTIATFRRAAARPAPRAASCSRRSPGAAGDAAYLVGLLGVGLRVRGSRRGRGGRGHPDRPIDRVRARTRRPRCRPSGRRRSCV